MGRRQAHLRALSIAWQLARLDIVRRYTATLLGMAWAILAPLCMAVVIGIVFGKLFGMPLRSFLPYLFLSLTMWSFFSASVDGGAISFLAAEGYIKQVPRVPFLTYPLRMVLAAAFTLVCGLLAVTLVIVVMGGAITQAWLWALPGLVIWFLFAVGVASLSGVANTAVRDFQHIQSVLVQALFYATPVMFPPQLLVDHGLRWFMTFNPLYHLLQLVRIPMLQNEPPPIAHFIAALLSLAAILYVARGALRRARPQLVFWL